MRKSILALLIITVIMASCSKQQGVEVEPIAKPVMFTINVNGVQNPEIFHVK